MISSSSSGGGERPLGARGLETSPRGTRSWTPRCSGHQKRTKNNNVSTCACHPSARVMRIREHKTHRGGCPRVVTHGATPHPPLRPSRGILANEPRVLQLWPACPWLLRKMHFGTLGIFWISGFGPLQPTCESSQATTTLGSMLALAWPRRELASALPTAFPSRSSELEGWARRKRQRGTNARARISRLTRATRADLGLLELLGS